MRPNRKEIQAYYQAHKVDFYAPERVKIAQIVKNVDEFQDRDIALRLVQQAHDRLNRGEPFAAVADQFSDCPGNGGELGWFGRGVMVDEFEQMAFSLAVAEVSPIFETRFGFHIVQLISRMPDGIRPLREVSDIISDLIFRKRLEAVGQ